MSISNPFRAAGTYRGDAYIERQADRRLRTSIEQNQRFPYILAPRQSGKSSLIANIRSSLPSNKYRSAFIDFSIFDSKLLHDYDAFLTAFFKECANELEITSQINLVNGEFSSGIKIILSECHERIVIFLDEIDFLIRADFKNTFFSTLRNIFNRRANNTEFNRIQFVLAGAARVDELIDDPSRSPFNVGEAIVLDNFTPDEVEKIASHLSSLGLLFDSSISKRIFYHTNGSIYFTQLILERLWYQIAGSQHTQISPLAIDQIVENIIKTSNRDIHFTNIFRQFQEEEASSIIRQFLNDQYISEHDRNILRHSGIFGESSIFRNRIYERVFSNGGLLDLLQPLYQIYESYYQNCIDRWASPRFELDKRFTQLTLLVDMGEDAQGPRWQSSRQFQDLREVLQTLDTPALVLLGPPGSGKSTLLRNFELDNAIAVLADSDRQKLMRAPLTFFVDLISYRHQGPDKSLSSPRDWLAQRWRAQYPYLPPLDTQLQEGRMILLLDALNEMPSAGREAIGLWKKFLLEMAQTCPGSRLIFSCRSLDYSSSLSSKDLTVPHVRIESLSDAQVEHFLRVYSPHGDILWRYLKGTPQLDLYRTPIYLKMLVNQADAEGHIPEGQAALFTGFVRQALQRECLTDNPRFQPDELLTQRDCERLILHRWRYAYDLPSQGILFSKLVALAYRMQEQRIATEASQVRIDYHRALAILDHAKAEDILKAGVDLGVLDMDVDDVLYIHQLMQEYFAARCLAAAPDAERVRTEWRADRIDPSLAQVLAKLADADPLPPAPVTGWEETTALAVAMSDQPDAFVTSLMEVNLPLAGRCAAQPDVRISADLKDRIRWALVERTQDSKADLRARIMAGLELGGLGDPRFERRQGPQGEYLLPPLVAIPGGTYPIGSDEGHYEDESPVHTVELAPFQIGKFPVTNAEWALFVQAGGYEDDRWWETAAAQAWRRGEGTAEGPKQQWRENRKWIQDNLDKLHEYRQFTSEDIKNYRRYAQMSDEAFERMLEGWYPPGRQVQPDFWNNDAYNKPAQPVVGISWYEARAYCAWLSAQTGMSFRLPTEVELEAAARGLGGRRYAYSDDYDVARCNTFETHIRRTAPVGVFPGGETPEGLVDMTGNTWDWTGSLYQPYPYDAGDGREDPAADDRRVVRGGAWGVTAVDARAACRSRSHPAGRNGVVGVRVVVGLSLI